MVLIATFVDLNVDGVITCIYPNPNMPGANCLKILQTIKSWSFQVKSWPPGLPKDKQEALEKAVGHCTNWMSVHRAVARELGAATITASQALEPPMSNLIASYEESRAKYNDLLLWAVKVVSMNIPADAPAHTGRNQFLEAARQLLGPDKPAQSKDRFKASLDEASRIVSTWRPDLQKQLDPPEQERP